MEKRFTRTLDLHGGGLFSRGVRYVRGDMNVYPLDLQLVARGEPFVIPDMATVFINFRRGDGTTDRAPAQVVDGSRGFISYEIQGGEISVPGIVAAFVQIVTPEQVLTFEQQLRIEVLDDPNKATVEPPEKFRLWVNSVDQELLRFAELLGSMEGGGSGGSGWSPVIVLALDGERCVLHLTDWAGGTGAKPELRGYLGEGGVVQNIAEAVDIRGVKGEQGNTGATGAKGNTGDQGEQGLPGTAGADGKSAFESAQTGGFTGGETQFNTDLASIGSKISSADIRENKVVTQAEYNAMKLEGTLEDTTAYDIIDL